MADQSIMNPDELESVNRAIASNITSSAIGTSHPGAPSAHPLIFSHTENSTLDAVIGQYRQGVIRVPASSTNMLANASFILLNIAILSAPYVTASYMLPQGAIKPSLSYYYGINAWQLNLSGIGNLQGNGISMLDMLLRSNPTDRRDFLSTVEPYAVGVTGGTLVSFCAPLYLPWNGPGWVGAGYNLDAAVSSSSFQINIQLYPPYQWIGGVGSGLTGGTLPTQFLSYEIKVMNQLDVLNQQFAPSKISSRGLFRLPFPYYQSYPLFTTANSGSQNIQSIQLQSVPNAELVSIIIHAIPSYNKGIPASTTAVDITPMLFDYYRLELQGNRLIELTTPREILIQNNYMSVGSSSGFNFDLINGAYTSVTGGINTYTSTTAVTGSGQLTCLECFTSNPTNFMDGNGVTQLAQNFSGQIFNFYYKFQPQYTAALYPFVDFFITYVSNGLLEADGGTFRLIT